MSLSLADIKRAKVQSFRDVADALDGMATANQDMKRGVERLPIMGDGWKGVSGDAAHHDLDAHGKYLDGHAQAQQGAAKKIRNAADEFEGVQQLLKKIENDATSGKFTINYDTGEVTPPNGKYDKNELDYLTNTLRQIRAAGEAANTDLEAAVKAAQTLPDPSGAAAQALPTMPGSAVKPGSVAAGLEHLAAPDPNDDPGATKAAAAVGSDTQANYKEWYPKNTVPVGDKNIDPSKLGGVGALPGVGNIDKTTPAKLAPTLADRDVPAFKDLTRQNLINAKVPADQIEQRVNDAVRAAQAPRFLPDADPMRTPGEVPLHNSPGDQFNDIVGRANDSATKTIDGQIDQAKVLTGQAGPGAPGVADAWKDVGLGAAKQVHELMTDPLAAPKMGIEQAKDFYNHPGEFIGKNMIVGTESLAAGAIGGEAAAGARGLLGDFAGTEGRGSLLDAPGLPHDATPAPGHAAAELPRTHSAPVADHTPTTVDHPAPAVDHSTPSGGHHPIPDSTPHFAPLPDTGPYQLPERAQVATPSDGAFFWSGRNADGTGIGPISAGGNGAADLIADGSRATTLEGLLDSNGIKPPKWSPTDDYAQQWWNGTSQMYAENASGEVRAVIGSNLRPGNVWQTVELPRLMDNPNVSRVVVIDPDTGIETIVFQR
ncbi:endonuclease [Mycobacteroides abscessus]|uniref:endonuclease n=1 Tax=Mycobacteroides abscessus TaxID=36809 RepID=UPI000C265A1C|nr:endonuclease [Mycobacteroides abscessus]